MPVTNIRSDWSSGNLVFYEKAVGRSTTGDVLTIGTTGVTVGNTGNDVDFTVYSGSNTFKIDCGSGALTWTGDVEITGDVDVSTEDIAVDQGKKVFLDGLDGSEYIYSGAAGKVSIVASGSGADDITLSGTVTISDDLTLSSGAPLICDDTTDSSSTTTGSIQTDGGLGVAKKVYVGTTLNVAGVANLDDTTEASAIGTASVVCDGGVSIAKKLYVGSDINVANAAVDLIVKANTDSALEVYDSTTKMLDVDTRNTVTGVSNFTMTAAPSTITAASGVTKNLLTLTPGTTTLTGSTGVTAMNGLGLSVAQPTVTDEDAVTVTTASTVYIANAPTGAGSGPATLTNAYALNVAAGSSVFGGDVLLSGESRIDLTSCTTAAANTDGGVIKCGTSSSRVTEDTADMKFMSFYFDNGAASGDNRGMYLRLYLTGGAGGEAARIFTTVEDTTAGTAHGAHTSLNFGSTGKITGLGVAQRCTLHIPDQAMAGGGTYAPIQAEVYSDGSSSDPAGMTSFGLIRCVNDGDAGGVADVNTDCNLLCLAGFSSASGNMYYANTAATGNHTASLRVNIEGVGSKYIYLWDAEA